MSHTDKELRTATQIAYDDFYKVIEKLEADQKSADSYTIEELVKVAKQYGIEGCVSHVAVVDETGNVVVNEGVPENVLDWKIVDCCNGTDSGFYGCVVETDQAGDAIVAFRGSEDATVYKNLIEDWLKADLFLLKGKETEQQKDVEKYIEYMNENGLLDKYKTIYTTGHSLGGNLAYHYGVTLAEKYPKLYEKLQGAVNFDGPGMAEEYMKKHKDGIDKVCEKVTHYRWSLVSACLEELPGVEPTFVSVNKDLDDECNEFTKHSTKYLMYDEQDSLINGQIDGLEWYIEKYTRGLDQMPSYVGNSLLIVLDAMVQYGCPEMFELQDGKMTGKLTQNGQNVVDAIKNGMITLVKNFPGEATLLAGSAVTVIAVMAVFPVIYEIKEEIVTYIVENLTNQFAQVLNFTKNEIQNIINYVMSTWNEWKNEFILKINSGYQYANENPYILVNTNNLRDYASRLNNVNANISNIDKEMDSLYWQVGLLDLWDLICTDALTGYSWKLQRAQNYLNDTADEFDAIENRIKSAFE